MAENLRKALIKVGEVAKCRPRPSETVILIGIPLTKERFYREASEEWRDFVPGLLERHKFDLDRDFFCGKLTARELKRRSDPENLKREVWQSYWSEVAEPMRKLISSARMLAGKGAVIEDATFADFQRVVVGSYKVISLLGHNIDPRGSNSIEMTDRIWTIGEIADALELLTRPVFFDITSCKGEVLAKLAVQNQYIMIATERLYKFLPVPAMYIYIRFLSLLNGERTVDEAYHKAEREYQNHLRRAE